jgi:sigma-B regulation protein RsbU (phosphoserine phosphatase)
MSHRAGVFRTIRGRLLFSILSVAMPIYAGALYLSYEATQQRLESQAERDADELAARLAAGIDAVIRPIEGGIRTVAGQLEEIDPPHEQYAARIRGILATWPDVYGSTIAVETGGGANSDGFAPYLFRRADTIAYSDLARESYAYRELPWYRRAADSRQPVWSLPYFDAGGGETWMVTYSVPFFRKLPDDRRSLAGVVTADLALDWVRQASANVPLGPAGMGWLISPPTTARPFVTPIGATEERIGKFDAALDTETIRRAGEQMLARNVTLALLPPDISAQPVYLAVRDLQTLDWRLMLLLPREALLADARKLLQRQLWLGAVGLLVLIGAITLVAAAISRPVHALADAVGAASEDNLAFPLPDSQRRDEVGVLTDALRRMRDSLQKHIRLRAESLAAEARLEYELQIAANIQQSMLPKQETAAVPASVRVAAALLPAKQVGGDLYDYFAIGENQLLFAVADVSDKGIPAALCMARSSALLRMLAPAFPSPDRLLHELNVRFGQANDANMFVTVGCGLLDIRTGRILYASAGHDPPLVRTCEGTVRQVSVENGPAIGIEPVAHYPMTETFLAPGDTLVAFTDGVTEASAQDGSQFGTDRLAVLLANADDGAADSVVRKIVDVAATGFRASDDFTVLAISLSPADVTAHRSDSGMHWLMEPEISAAGVAQAQQWLYAILATRAVSAEQIGEVELIAEELLTNVVRSLQARAGNAHLSLECALTPTEIVLTVVDDGPQFDPLAHEAPEPDRAIDERAIGGLGIVIVRELADRCRYTRVDGRNVMEIRLHRMLT